MRLDPTRTEFNPQLPLHDLRFPGGPIGSLLLHLLPLLILVGWPRTPAELSAAIPIQVVFEQPASPSAPAGFSLLFSRSENRLAAPDILGEAVSPPVDERSTEEALPALPTFGEPHLAAVETRAPDVASPPPLPAPATARQSAPDPPAQDPTLRANVDTKTPEALASSPLTLATRDDYLAYLVTLTRQHLDLLPLSAIGGRRGATVISVVVYDDGSIAQISVFHSSGYPDIDRRIQELVTAVGKFPPIPRQFQGTAMQLELTVRFPETWEQ